MSAIKPYSGASIERFATMLSSSSIGQNLVLGEDFTLGALSLSYPADKWNTKIRIIPTDTEVYINQYLYYNRLSITALGRLPAGEITPVVITSFPFSIHGILDDINEALGLNLIPGEVINEIHQKRNTKYPLKIKKGGSVVWLPSTYLFDAIIDDGTNSRELENGGIRILENGDVRTTE